MIQAARSGRQNIAEGTSAGATSAETEIKLINVARASLQELLLDYEDFLRVRNLCKWELKFRKSSKDETSLCPTQRIIILYRSDKATFFRNHSQYCDYAHPSDRRVSAKTFRKASGRFPSQWWYQRTNVQCPHQLP